MPNLGIVEGILDDVIHYAVHLTGFWQADCCGEITKINVKRVDKKTIAIGHMIRERKKKLEAELHEINIQLSR
jgi:hypothetical protein